MENEAKGRVAALTACDEFQAYVYQLIKSRLVTCVKSKLKTVLTVDMPHSMEVFTSKGIHQFQSMSKSKTEEVNKFLSASKKVSGDGLRSSSKLSYSSQASHVSDSAKEPTSKRSSSLSLKRPSRR